MLRLDNLTDASFTVTLYHEKYCANGGECKCVVKMFRHPVQQRDGSFKPELESRYIPVSVTILPRKAVSNLHEAALQVPQIDEALRRGTLRKIVIATPTPTAAPAVPQVAADSHPPSADESADAGEDESAPRSRKSRRGTSKSRS